MAHFRGRWGRTRAGAAASRSTRGSASERGRQLNYARRHQYRRLSHASNAALGSAVTVLLGLVVGGAGAGPLAGLLFLTAVGAGPLCSPLAFARSPESSRRPLGGRGAARASPLQAEGWRLRHSLSWQGGGDIDSVAIAPIGVVVAIETKTRTYDVRHLARVHEQAVWLSRRRRRWCRHGVLAVLCLVRVREVQRVEDDVLVVSIDRLMPAVRSAAGAVRPPLRSGWRRPL